MRPMKGLGIHPSWAERAWRTGRRVGVAAAVAVLVAGVGSRVNRQDGGLTADSGLEAVLSRRVARADVDVRSLRRAAESLGRAAGVRVVVDEKLSIAPEPAGAEPLHVVDRPLGWALGRVLGQFGVAGKVDLTYVVEGGGIRIGGADRLGDSDEVGAYDVGDILRPFEGRRVTRYGFSGPFEQDARQEAADDLVHLLIETTAPTIWGINGGPSSMSMWGDWLVVSAPAQAQRDVARMLFVLRHPAPPGIGLKTAGGR